MSPFDLLKDSAGFSDDEDKIDHIITLNDEGKKSYTYYYYDGDRLSFMGGIDVRVLYTNDQAQIEAELAAKVPVVKGHYGYVLHSDHSIPDQVDYGSYRFFVDRGMEIGRY